MEFQVWLSIGGFAEKATIPNTTKAGAYNTHLFIDPLGAVQNSQYRKIHLFDSPLTNLFESETTVAGLFFLVLGIKIY